MIERLLAADAALARGELDAAERLFRQVADADSRNAIAAVGLGRVAAGRDDADGARAWFVRALEIDPQEAAARRLLAALERELALGAPTAETQPAVPAPAVRPPAGVAPATQVPATPAPVADVPSASGSQPAPGSQSPRQTPRKRPSLVARIRTWLGLMRGG